MRNATYVKQGIWKIRLLEAKQEMDYVGPQVGGWGLLASIPKGLEPTTVLFERAMGRGSGHLPQGVYFPWECDVSIHTSQEETWTNKQLLC